MVELRQFYNWSFMHTFIPFGVGKETTGTWMGGINITPALTFEEANFLSRYLMTWHFADKKRDLEGLYVIHNDKQREIDEVLSNGKIIKIPKEAQEYVPSFVSPLILGSNNWNKKSVVNTIGVKTHIVSLKHSASWILFLIEHFFKKDAYAKHLFSDSFGDFKDHVCNGVLLYQDSSKSNACTVIKVEDNVVSSFGVKKTYQMEIDDGFTMRTMPYYAKDAYVPIDYLFKKEGLKAPSANVRKAQDEKIKIKDVWKNIEKDSCIYAVAKPTINLPEKFLIEYEQYYMDNTIPLIDEPVKGKISKF